MLFSKSNPPPDFYHYLYLREDGTPYYSGKGKGKRAWVSNHSVSVPKDLSRIIITHWNLTELWAFALERWHIRWYGRKDTNTGILRNMTDGGDGAAGAIQSEENRKKKSLASLGKPKSAQHIANIIANHLPRDGNNNPFYGKTHSEESKKLIGNRDYSQQRGSNHCQSRSVRVNGVKFSTITLASSTLGIPQGTIADVLKKRVQFTKKVWEAIYINDADEAQS